jgi:enamine deaminase RidA (YjgF/YER057c/UK114 family)
VNPDDLAPPSGYSNGIVASGGAALHVAGQVGWDREGRMISDDFVAQFDQALGNVLSVVTAAGGRADGVTRMRIYVTELEDYRSRLEEVGASYRARMGKHFPAMALVQVAALLEPGARVEIEADAVVPEGPEIP